MGTWGLPIWVGQEQHHHHRDQRSPRRYHQSLPHTGIGEEGGEEEKGGVREEGGVGRREGSGRRGVRRRGYIAGCLTTWRNEWKALNNFFSQLRLSQVSENNNSTYSFWHKEMCEKHTLCCRRKVQPVYSRIAKQLHRVLGNHMVAIMTTPSAPQLTGQPPVEQTEGSVHI